MKTAAGVSRETLELVPERLFRFLYGLSRNPIAVRALAQYGFDEAERDRGVALLDAVLRHRAYDVENPVPAAMKAIEEAYPQIMELLRLTLLAYPDVAETVLAPMPVLKARHREILFMDELLRRLDTLDTTRGAKDAKERIAVRGLNAGKRKHLRGLVDMAKQGVRIDPDRPSPTEVEARGEAALLACKTWLEEWTGFARVAIPRRDVLVRLGLTTPRGRSDAPSDPPSDAG